MAKVDADKAFWNLPAVRNSSQRRSLGGFNLTIQDATFGKNSNSNTHKKVTQNQRYKHVFEQIVDNACKHLKIQSVSSDPSGLSTGASCHTPVGSSVATSQSFWTMNSVFTLGDRNNMNVETLQFEKTKSLPAASSRFDSLAEFEQRRTIGKGTFGRVKLVQHTRTGECFALKIVKKSNIVDKRKLEHTLSEKDTLLSFHHPHIVKLHSTFTCDKCLYFLLEWLPGGDLFTRLRDEGRFSITKTKFYAANIVLALEHMHKHGVVFRDLKPENIMLDHRGYLKLVDFGYAKKLSGKTFTACGTPDYVAPEIIRTTGHDHMVDWWSLGIVIYELLTGFPPFFSEASTLVTYRKILLGDLKFPRFLCETVQDLIRGLLAQNSNERLGSNKGAEDIKSHPWFHGFDWTALDCGYMQAPIQVSLKDCCDDQFFDKYSETTSLADFDEQFLQIQEESKGFDKF